MNRVRAASADTSLHVLGLAYDGEPDPKNDRTWELYGQGAEAVGLVWGGRWTRQDARGETVTDRPHCQVPGRPKTIRLLAGAGLTIAVTVVVALAVREQVEARPPLRKRSKGAILVVTIGVSYILTMPR